MRATDTLFSTTAQFQILRVPTSSNGTTFGPGSANNLLKSNGTSVYWTTLVASDIPTLSITDKTSGTLPVTRGGTGVTAISNIQAGKDGDGNTISSTYLKLSGGTLTGNLTLSATSGNSPALIFNRDGSLTDWKIFVTSGKLSFQSTTDASTWIERASFADNSGNFTTTGTITATKFIGPLEGNVTGNVTGSSGSCTGNAATATKFASSQSITLTGDTTGTVSSQAGWSITTKTDRLSFTGDNRAVATKPDDYNSKIIFQGLKNKGDVNSPSNDNYSYVIGLRGWTDDSGGKAHEFAFNDSGINHRIGLTTSWENWEKIITSGNYTNYTVTKTGSGASGTWGISITGNAATATKATQDADGNTISSTYLKLSGGTLTGNLVAKKITIEHTSGGQQEYRVTYGSTVDMSLMIGTGNENHGIYDSKASKWMIYADTSGNVTVNGNAATATYANSAGSVAWGNVSGKPNRAGSDSDGGPAQTVKGAYTSNGGRQNPNYFGVNKVGFLMMNTTVNGNSHCKDWLIMDCYSGSDVGGGVAIGVNRQALGAYIMRSAAARSSWAESAELLGTHNYTSYCPTKTGSGASGTWGISVTGNAANVTGTVAVAHGGTGATNAAGARSNLGLSATAVNNGSSNLWHSYDGNPRLLVYGGTLCVLHIGGYTNAAITKRTAILTIPSGYRPAHEVGTLLYNASANSYAYWNVKPNGVLSSESDSPNGYWYAGTLVWFIDK